MRFLNVIAACLLAGAATAWQPEDHEIFRIRDDVIAHEGPDTTFYSLIGVTRKSTMDEINRAYRKVAARAHPDKARQSFIANYGKVTDPATGKTTVDKKKRPSQREIDAFHKEADARFKRLSIIATILRGENRDRYDFFLDHGFPAWRGTGYYYARYRPGAGTVLIGLFIVVGGGAHYLALYMGWKQQRQFAQKYILNARKMAWGNGMVVPGLDTAEVVPSAAQSNGAESAMNRRQKRMQDKELKKNAKKGIVAEDISEPIEATLVSGPQGNKRRVVAENGKVLIVDSVGNVFLEETSEEGETNEFLIDINEIHPPTIKDTVLFRFPVFLWNKTGGRFIGGSVDVPYLNDDEKIEHDINPAIKNATASSANGEARRRNNAKVRRRP
ncbi:hypothetical protein BT63DRAFT_412527 [Microthyrium microscopicum]|uniref:J domain-containing protein n=1 Tax=Microthyrium microscopicum TaxID=703497 RepID=A0A6A6UJ50_9PEZI|nr:hypothetical protein BT63DRAFT_412527 [Microthyrium microscopicum]